MLRYEFIDPDLQIGSCDFQFIESFLKATGRTQIGWHYITDITWIYSQVKHWPREFKILDAGGGTGPVQFLMAELGFDVTNIDMCLHEPLPVYKKRYMTKRTILPSFRPTSYKDFLESFRKPQLNTLKSKTKLAIKKTSLYQLWHIALYTRRHTSWRRKSDLSDSHIGEIQWVVGNLCSIPEIPSQTFDAVVSLSALEHIPLEFLEEALNEINRVLKPGARWAVTTSSTEQLSTWLHEPSRAYCFSAADLEKIFRAQPAERQDSQEILQIYRRCTYLKENMAKSYFKSGKKGMPWGVWDPKYIPVGIFT